MLGGCWSYTVPLKIHGLFTVLSTCSLSFIVSFLAYLPGLILLQMSPFTLIKLFLGSAFKGRGSEEEEHLCAVNESRAGWVGLEMVLPFGFEKTKPFGFEKGQKTDILLVATQIWVFTAVSCPCWPGHLRTAKITRWNPPVSQLPEVICFLWCCLAVAWAASVLKLEREEKAHLGRRHRETCGMEAEFSLKAEPLCCLRRCWRARARRWRSQLRWQS